MPESITEILMPNSNYKQYRHIFSTHPAIIWIDLLTTKAQSHNVENTHAHSFPSSSSVMWSVLAHYGYSYRFYYTTYAPMKRKIDNRQRTIEGFHRYRHTNDDEKKKQTICMRNIQKNAHCFEHLVWYCISSMKIDPMILNISYSRISWKTWDLSIIDVVCIPWIEQYQNRQCGPYCRFLRSNIVYLLYCLFISWPCWRALGLSISKWSTIGNKTNHISLVEGKAIAGAYKINEFRVFGEYRILLRHKSYAWFFRFGTFNATH